RLVVGDGGDRDSGRGAAPRARHHRRICRPHSARDAQAAELHRGGDGGGSAGEFYTTAVITRPTFSKISPICASLTISGGVSAIVSPVTRTTRFSSLNAA